MAEARIWHVSGYEQHPLSLFARVRHSGQLITQAGVNAITCKVRRIKKSDRSVDLVGSPSVTVNSAVFDELQTPSIDPSWDRDSIGYNFAFAVDSQYFPTPDNYAIVFIFDPTSGGDFPLIFEGPMLSLRGAV